MAQEVSEGKDTGLPPGPASSHIRLRGGQGWKNVRDFSTSLILPVSSSLFVGVFELSHPKGSCPVEKGAHLDLGSAPELSETAGLATPCLEAQQLWFVCTADPAAGHRVRLQAAGQLHPRAERSTARLHCLQGLPNVE